jgi:predicted transcriptional regulator
MSTKLFEHLSETEAYVFSFVAYFACDESKGFIFKRTTASLCKNLGYSPNTVRSAISSLVSKGFLKSETPPEREKSELKYTYIEDVSHHLKIGNHDAAFEFAYWMEIMLIELRTKGTTKGFYEKYKPDVTFFKVPVSALQTDSIGEKWKRNQSRHLHKTLILHAYLHNQDVHAQKYNKPALSRSVAFLSTMMQWSRNTIRRIINTMSNLGLIKFKLSNNRILFTKINKIKKIRDGYTALKSKLHEEAVERNEALFKNLGLDIPRPGPDATAEQHSAYWQAMTGKQRYQNK